MDKKCVMAETAPVSVSALSTCTVAIAGLGLMGGSLALARRGHVQRVVGIARRAETVQRALAIGAIGPFDAKALRRVLRGEGIEIFKRDFPLTPEEIHARTGTHAGSRQRLAFTRIGGKLWTIRLAAEAPETVREG